MQTSYYLHGWVVASYIVVGVMAVIALGLLEPANIAVLVELKKPQPNPQMIERLMKRFIYCAGLTGHDADRHARDHDQAGLRMSAAHEPTPHLPPSDAQLGMASLALIVAGGIYLTAHIPNHVPLGPAITLLGASVLLLAGNLLALSRVQGFAWRAFFERSPSGRCWPTRSSPA